MNTRWATHAQPASLDSGVGDNRLATMAKITRSTTAASTRRAGPRRLPTTSMIWAPIPSRGHSHRVGGVQEPADALDQPGQPLAVHPVGAPEVVDDLRLRHARVPVALV